jgi:threonylcarbamoyladenosine tRNA methylthiotransferase MtaB
MRGISMLEPLHSRSMASFSVRFLGCKVSQTDAQALRDRLVRDGHREVEGRGDVAVVNSCCVTNEGLAKSRQSASRAARTFSRVYVTGCGARLSETAFAGLPENVTVVTGQIEQAVETVAGDVGAIGCVQADARLDRVRAFVKIQDGCSFSCAFCVIPLVRGATRSRSAEAVLGEIRKRVAQGHREIVLTGVNLGCFRDRAAGHTLPSLIRAAGAIEGVQRLRLSSIEINHVDDELVAALRETPVVGPHLHVPLQSGDDRVLRAMSRRYSVETYLRKLEPLRDFNLTADVIVGFPAEDEPAFERTLETVRAARLTKVHVFPYSPRPGTRTAGEDTVPPEVKKERSARLRALSDRACRDRWAAKVGRDDVVLVDRPGRGYGADYSPWLVEAPLGELVPVTGRAVTEEGILAA